MKRNGLYILARVAKRGEVPLDEAIQMAHGRRGDHRDQYPLALLLEARYLGMTINYSPPEGAELMREYALAITLHMYLRPPEADGVIRYMGVTTTGGLDPKRERVFLTAKGALYLDEFRQKRWDRIWSVALGFATGLLVAVCAAWVKNRFRW